MTKREDIEKLHLLSTMPTRLPLSRVQKLIKYEITEELPADAPRLYISSSVAPLMAAACEMLMAEITIKA